MSKQKYVLKNDISGDETSYWMWYIKEGESIDCYDKSGYIPRALVEQIQEEVCEKIIIKVKEFFMGNQVEWETFLQSLIRE